MKLWQKNLMAVLAVTLLVLGGMCALLLADGNRGRLDEEKAAVQREFSTALTALQNSAGLYPDNESEQHRAAVRSLQVNRSLGGRATWLLLSGEETLYGSWEEMPLSVLPRAEAALSCALYPGTTGPVLLCAQHAAEYTLYGAWPAAGLWAAGRSQAARMGLLLMGAAGALTLLLFFLARGMFRPLKALEKSARAIAAGDYRRRVRPCGVSDMDALGESFNEMAAAVQAHLDALERENAQQRRFVANLAHEMKTPMTAMIGYSDLLLGERVPEGQRREAYQYIAQQARRLNELSQKLMQLSGLSGQEPPAFAPLSLKTLLEAALAAAAPLAEKKGVALLPPTGDARISGEETLLISLLTNLLTNACKASPAGGRIVCAAGADETGAFAWVQDEGDGVPEDALLLLTEPFYMVDKSRARKENGAGVGLTLCREIARLHGGEMRFENLHPGFRAGVRLPEDLQFHDKTATPS